MALDPTVQLEASRMTRTTRIHTRSVPRAKEQSFGDSSSVAASPLDRQDVDEAKSAAAEWREARRSLLLVLWNPVQCRDYIPVALFPSWCVQSVGLFNTRHTHTHTDTSCAIDRFGRGNWSCSAGLVPLASACRQSKQLAIACCVSFAPVRVCVSVCLPACDVYVCVRMWLLAVGKRDWFLPDIEPETSP